MSCLGRLKETGTERWLRQGRGRGELCWGCGAGARGGSGPWFEPSSLLACPGVHAGQQDHPVAGLEPVPTARPARRASPGPPQNQLSRKHSLDDGVVAMTVVLPSGLEKRSVVNGR